MKNTMTDRLRLDGKVALVTGGAGGMGQAIAESLSDLGAKVVLTDVSESVAEVAATLGDKGDWLVADLTDSAAADQAVAETVTRHGRLDILVANAGISYQSTTAEHDDATWRKVMAINLDGTFYAMRAAGRRMLKQEGGAIIGISSICAVTSARPELHIGYDASKAAVARMCRNLAVEWAKAGIRVNAVAPAYTKTAMLRASGDTQPGYMKQWCHGTSGPVDDLEAARSSPALRSPPVVDVVEPRRFPQDQTAQLLVPRALNPNPGLEIAGLCHDGGQ